MIKNIAVIGAGTMGNGIAQIFAQHGYPVSLIDINEDAVAKGIKAIEFSLDRLIKKEKISTDEKMSILSRVHSFISIEEGVAQADLVIEVVPERLPLKKSVLEQVDQYAPTTSLIASNTSSISITELASFTTRPAQFIGMHFMNPVPIMTLVEIIRGYSTSDETTDQIATLSKSIGKVPIEVNDYPGFVSNRVLMPMLNEAITALHEGVAGVAEIDSIMQLGMAHPMGPLYLADYIGLDTCLSILRVLQDGFGLSKYAPCPLLVNMVRAGKLGRKSGEGFYSYSPGSKEKVVSEAFM